ncbi:immunoglobulin domain-containing protein [Thermomonas sp.]|uniref:immunoglobulin domain-containing protein n=1 Tax=Thermomonas sp. TaxID=1971895 RepID=UPI0037836037
MALVAALCLLLTACGGGGGRSTPGGNGSGIDKLAPTAPTQLAANASSASVVHLSWTASTDNKGVAKYLIYRNGQAQALAETAQTGFDDATVTGDTSYSYAVRAADAASNLSPSSASVSVRTPAVVIAPAITAQPVALTVKAGAAASFSVSVTGTAPLTYRWYRDAVTLASCIGATCTIVAASAADAGSYKVEVSNSAGSATSQPALLTVTPVQHVVTAANCSVSAVQAAVDQAVNGDVVQIPAGATCSWGGLDKVTVAGKNLWIRGAGKGATVIRRGSYIDTANTSENDIALTALFVFACDAGTRVRFSDMTLQGNGREGTFVGTSNVTFPQLLAYDYGIKLWACRDFRIHDTRFEKFGYAGIDLRSSTLSGVDGSLRGVIDHNEFVGNMKVGLGYGVSVYGNDDWPAPDYGSANHVFVEDNDFEDNRHNIAANNGARYVFRYNRQVTTYRARWWSMVDAHGRGDGDHGTRSFEVYHNSFGMTGIPDPASATGAVFRGGDGVFFNNTIQLGLSWAPGNPPYGLWLTVENNGCTATPKPVYPAYDQTTDLYIWGNTNNNVSFGGDNWDVCAAYFKEGRDFHIKPRPGYVPYTYPHPLRAQVWPVP